MSEPRQRPLLRYLPIAAIAVLLAAALALRLHDQISLRVLYERAEALDAAARQNLPAALALFAALYAAAVAVSLPGASVLTMAGGFLFGVLAGGGAAWAGAVLGASLIFLAARTAFGDALKAQAGSWLDKLAGGFRDNAFNYLLALRLTPVAPFFVVNVAPAFFGVKLRDFALATAIGIVPGTFVYAWVGAGLRTALRTGAEADPDSAARALLTSPAILGPVLGLAALSLLPVAVKVWRSRAAKRLA